MIGTSAKVLVQIVSTLDSPILGRRRRCIISGAGAADWLVEHPIQPPVPDAKLASAAQGCMV
jgi:hypothetical protein